MHGVPPFGVDNVTRYGVLRFTASGISGRVCVELSTVASGHFIFERRVIMCGFLLG